MDQTFGPRGDRAFGLLGGGRPPLAWHQQMQLDIAALFISLVFLAMLAFRWSYTLVLICTRRSMRCVAYLCPCLSMEGVRGLASRLCPTLYETLANHTAAFSTRVAPLQRLRRTRPLNTLIAVAVSSAVRAVWNTIASFFVSVFSFFSPVLFGIPGVRPLYALWLRWRPVALPAATCKVHGSSATPVLSSSSKKNGISLLSTTTTSTPSSANFLPFSFAPSTVLSQLSSGSLSSGSRPASLSNADAETDVTPAESPIAASSPTDSAETSTDSIRARLVSPSSDFVSEES